ncbi:MAG: zinc-binding dehydrogenase, partial [Verrucomicrobiota bacterium]|nr:zinc-binding dehydrogenase [Verrucomicrobiota bacterium]
MKAIRLTQLGAPLEEQEIPIPEPRPNEALIRIKGAGICHSDAHYRSGVSSTAPLPLTLGHEIAGLVEEVGAEVRNLSPGDRVCVHYLVTCGECERCRQGNEQFCNCAEMIGKHRDGGYAEFIAVPERSLFRLPAEILFAQGAILMCSSATSLHALHKARLKSGETVAIFGLGGLGISAVQLAKALGAAAVYVVDINRHKLELATRFGAIPVDPVSGDPVAQLRDLTEGNGVDVALELVGLPVTMRQAVQSLAVLGRAALVGLTQQPFEVTPYTELINK